MHQTAASVPQIKLRKSCSPSGRRQGSTNWLADGTVNANLAQTVAETVQHPLNAFRSVTLSRLEQIAPANLVHGDLGTDLAYLGTEMPQQKMPSAKMKEYRDMLRAVIEANLISAPSFEKPSTAKMRALTLGSPFCPHDFRCL